MLEYMAGLFDGEGSIFITYMHIGKVYHQLREEHSRAGLAQRRFMAKKEKIGNCPMAPVAGQFWKGDADGNVTEAIPNVPCEYWANGICLWFKPACKVSDILAKLEG